MKYLGIDFGSKNVGIAVSDEEGRMAYPKSVLKNNENLLEEIEDLITKENIQEVVIGESVNAHGKANPIMQAINDFVGQLSITTMLPVHFQKESLTSLESAKQNSAKPTARKPKQKMEKKDDSAAALILQRFLDTKRK